MDIGSASALTGYAYHTTLTAGGATGSPASRQAAVLQALTAAYEGASSDLGGLLPAPDALSGLAGSSSLASLMSGIYATALASGKGGTLSSTFLQAQGGWNASATASLLATAGSGSLAGFSPSSLSLEATLALSAYTDAQGTASAASSQPSTVQQILQAAESSRLATTLNLFA